MTNMRNINFSIDGYQVPKYYDTNSDGKLSNTEMNIWLDDNGYVYDNNKIVELSTDSPEDICKNIKNSLPNKGLLGFLSSFIANNSEVETFVKSININNIQKVLETYNNSNCNLIKDIMENENILENTRINCINRIVNMYIKSLKNEGIYVDDYQKLLLEHIEYAKESDNMDSIDILEDMKTLELRKKAFYESNPEDSDLSTLDGTFSTNFNQGLVRDCWLLGPIKSMMANPKGLEELKSVISINSNGDAEVTLKGVDKKYTIKKEEIQGAVELSQGDMDVRAIEIAIINYLHEIGDHLDFKKKFENEMNDAKILKNNLDINDGSSRTSMAYYLLFGDSYDRNSILDSAFFEKAKSNKYSISVYAHKNTYYPGKAIRPNGESVRLENLHVYGVVGADDEYIYFKDPLERDGERNNLDILKMSHKDFYNAFYYYYAHEYN